MKLPFSKINADELMLLPRVALAEDSKSDVDTRSNANYSLLTSVVDCGISYNRSHLHVLPPLSVPSSPSLCSTSGQLLNLFVTVLQEMANMYTEHKVIKTNQRGKKQERLMGIDGTKIYNNKFGSGGEDVGVVCARMRCPRADELCGLVCVRETGTKVHRPFRLLSEVVSIEIMQQDPRCFRVTFRDKTGIEVREYQAETKTDCAQIVAKIQFLTSQ